MSLTDDQRSLRGRIAANERWSRPGAKVRRRGPLWKKFEQEAREADPGASDKEIAERVQSKYQAHMARMALASSKAAAERRQAREMTSCTVCGNECSACTCPEGCCPT